MSDNPAAEPLSLADAATQIAGLDVESDFTPEPETDLPEEDNSDREAEANDAVETEDDPEESVETADAEETESEDNVEEDAEETNEDAEETFLVQMTINGETVEKEVSGEELVNGYQRLEDYRIKTSELARERETFQAEAKEVEVQKAQYAQALQQVQGMLEQSIPQEPDWADLAQNDPLGYAEQRAKWDHQQRQLETVRSENQRLSAEREKSFFETEARKLPEAIPAWRDQEVAAKEKPALLDYALKAGYSQEVIKYADSLSLATLRKAWLYDTQQKEKPRVIEKVKKAPKLVKSGTPSSRADSSKSQRNKEINRLQKSGKLEDALPLLMRT